jgi:hypothetical protein
MKRESRGRGIKESIFKQSTPVIFTKMLDGRRAALRLSDMKKYRFLGHMR